MDSNAIVPDTPIIESEDMVEHEAEMVSQAVSGDREIAELYLHKGWHKVEQKLDQEIEKFRTGSFMDVKGMPLAEVGQKFIIASEVARICEDIKSLVHNAAQSVVEHERRNQ
jgi:hypothetical protein